MHEQSFTQEEQDGKYQVYSSVTLQPLSESLFNSQQDADRFAEQRSFTFGMARPQPVKKSGPVQHSTSLLDGD